MKTRLLIVDKNAKSAEILADYFDERGYDTDVATNDQVALNLLSEKIIRLVIIDLDTPSSTPEMLLERIRTDFPATKLIALAERPSVITALDCLRNQTETLILKPLDDLKELEEALADARSKLEHWNRKLLAVVDEKRAATHI